MKTKLFLVLFVISVTWIIGSCSRKDDSYNARSFIGTWSSSQVGKITLNCDGTWQVSKCNFGKWFLRNNNMVWTYSDNPGKEDINPILRFKPDEFVLREMNGATTVFKKVE